MTNKTSLVWQQTIDALQKDLEKARDVPLWLTTVFVISLVCMLCALIMCGIACGVILHQSSLRGVEVERISFSTDSQEKQSVCYDVPPDDPASQKQKLACSLIAMILAVFVVASAASQFDTCISTRRRSLTIARLFSVAACGFGIVSRTEAGDCVCRPWEGDPPPPSRAIDCPHGP